MNTRSTLHKQLQCNNELTYYTSITRKAKSTICNFCNHLQFAARYAIIGEDNTRHRKEWSHDRYEGKVLYSRTNCRDLADLSRYRDAAPKRRRAKRYQNQRAMARSRECVRGISGKPDQHQVGRQINKATAWWHWTIEKITAVRLFLTDWNPRRNSPWCTLPISIVTLTLKRCQWLYKSLGTLERCVCP